MVRESIKDDAFESEELFKQMEDAIRSDGAEIAKQMRGVFSFVVTNAGGHSATWTVDVKTTDSAGVERNSSKKADVTLTLSDRDLVDLMAGRLDAQKAFFQGKLIVKGNMTLALQLKTFQKQLERFRSKL